MERIYPAQQATTLLSREVELVAARERHRAWCTGRQRHTTESAHLEIGRRDIILYV